MMRSRRALLVGALLALSTRSEATRAQDEDPVTGVWEGRLAGDHELIPPEGVEVRLLLERLDEYEVRLRLEFEQGEIHGTAEGDFDPEDGWLELQLDLMGILLDIEATLVDGVLEGELSGLGVSASIEARRVALELPEIEEVGARPLADPASLTPEDWRADLQQLLLELPERHADAFHGLSEERWKEVGAEIEVGLPSMDAHASALALGRLVALIGDAHTHVLWRALSGWYVLPVRFELLSDGVFVSSIDERWSQGLGARVVRLGGLSIDEALDRVATTFAFENESWRRYKLQSLLATPRLLAALGVIESEEALPLVVEVEPGVEEALVVGPALPGSSALRAPDPETDPVPISSRRKGEAYWSEVIDGTTLYLAYNRCAEDPQRPMADFSAKLFAGFDELPAERLIVDLRDNSGGNSTVFRPILDGIEARPRLAERGRLVALIGRRTFSSGMRNALELREAGAVLVGEPTGGRPNSYGEVRSFQLARSGLPVYYSTKLFSSVEGDPPSVMPDERVELDSRAFFFGQDPALERALELPLEPGGR